MTSPYRPRHRRPRGAHGRSGSPSRLPTPSDIILVVLSLVLLLASAFVVGGLLAHPF